MAGTLVISTLSDGTNSTSSTNCIQGSAKAWACFGGGNGTTGGAINASYNVSSITFSATATYTVNFTNALSDGNYVPVSGCNTDFGNVGGIRLSNNPANAPDLKTTTQCRFYGVSGAGIATTTYQINVAFFR
jgi:hypothetical protein